MDDIKKKQLILSIDKYIEEHIEPEVLLQGALCKRAPRTPKADKVFDEVKICSKKPDRSLDEIVLHVDDTFQQKLFNFIDTKKLDEVEVYKKAHIDRRLFSKIRSNINFKPSRKTALSLCFGLELNLDESRDLLKRAGYYLSHSSVSDLIIEYLIQNGVYDLMVVNEILFNYKQEPLNI